ncbi:uncharacterized protein Pyn_29372 [Prunus yedoensis var. nudiflora]|uniref:Uncharacterized protein n=1 Tax=Prunus yedoensis var. nudiflora TaxID=2094558 RepID=A0A314Y6J8_PRUYE|nr:uncharacterized protein Pyn_29372 [Prunus yedoensis var. nudiflora]
MADFIDEAFQLQFEKRRKKSTSIRRRADKIEKAMEAQQTKSVAVTILHNATIITMEPDARVFRNGGVVIETQLFGTVGSVYGFGISALDAHPYSYPSGIFQVRGSPYLILVWPRNLLLLGSGTCPRMDFCHS